MTEQAKPKQWPPPTLSEALRWFATDPVDNGIVIIGDDELTRVLVAFRNTEHKWSMPRKAAPAESSTLVAKWRWLTATWKFDLESLVLATGMSEETIDHKIDMLVANRLIYPDGTIARGALTALQANGNMKLGGKPGRTAGRAAPAAPKETK